MAAGGKNARKSATVAFKVEGALADYLDGLPNKSDFIRRAIYAQLGVSCPLCRGTGSVTTRVHDQFASFLDKYELHHCDGCGDEFALPKDADMATGILRDVVANAAAGDKEYCVPCYVKEGEE